MHPNSKTVDYAETYLEVYQKRLLESDCEALSESALRTAEDTTTLPELIELWGMVGAKCGNPKAAEQLRNGTADHSRLAELSFKDMMKSMVLEKVCSSWADLPERLTLLLERLYQTADVQEQQLIIQVLPLLESQERFLRIATEAARTNIVPVFSSLALDNPFPQEHFTENQWNQMVLKTIFVGCDIAKIVGLHERHNSALSETIFQYVSERHSAHRTVPRAVVQLCEGALSNASQSQLNSIKPDLRQE